MGLEETLLYTNMTFPKLTPASLKIGSTWSLKERYAIQLVIFSLGLFLLVAITTMQAAIFYDEAHLIARYGKTLAICFLCTFWVPLIPAKLMSDTFKIEEFICLTLLNLYLAFEVVQRGFLNAYSTGGAC